MFFEYEFEKFIANSQICKKVKWTEWDSYCRTVSPEMHNKKLPQNVQKCGQNRRISSKNWENSTLKW